MGVNISQQLALFLRSVLLGGVLGLLYDLLRPFRRRCGRLGEGLLDALYGVTAVSALFFFVMAGDGELRIFVVMGTIGGAVLFFCLLSQAMTPVWEFWAALLLAPLGWVKKFLGKCRKNFKKLFSFWRKWFTIISTRRRPKAPPAKEGEDEMAGQTKQTAVPAKSKKRPSGRLTAIILLALFLGIGIQFLNMYGKLQEAKAEEAVYAAQLADLQETNQRLAEDIANSQDPELIEKVARDDLGMADVGEKIFRFSN